MPNSTPQRQRALTNVNVGDGTHGQEAPDKENSGVNAKIDGFFKRVNQCLIPSCCQFSLFGSSTKRMERTTLDQWDQERRWCKRGSYAGAPWALTGSYVQLRAEQEKSLIYFTFMMMFYSFIRFVTSLYMQMKPGEHSRDNTLSLFTNFVVLLLSILAFANSVIITAFKADGQGNTVWMNVLDELQYAVGAVLIGGVVGEMTYYVLSQSASKSYKPASGGDLERGADEEDAAADVEIRP